MGYEDTQDSCRQRFLLLALFWNSRLAVQSEEELPPLNVSKQKISFDRERLRSETSGDSSV